MSEKVFVEDCGSKLAGDVFSQKHFQFIPRMVSATDVAKRALVTVIKYLAGVYGVTADLNRDCDDNALRKAYRTMSLKVHPDRGGDNSHQTQLNVKYEAWCNAKSDKSGPGRPRGKAAPCPKASKACKPGKKDFELRAIGFLLTYQGFQDLLQWRRFLEFVAGLSASEPVLYWTATLETNADGKHHAHLMLQMSRQKKYCVNRFLFEGLRPNAQANDVFGEGWCKKPGRYQVSMDRGHFYVWANKKGTVVDETGALCVSGNYAPAWTGNPCSYVVKVGAQTAAQTSSSSSKTSHTDS